MCKCCRQFCGRTFRMAYAERLDDPATESLREAFSIGTQRSFEQDPRFGLSVLAEIASHALSPAVNDPGTAIDVIGRAVRVLSLWKGRSEAQEAPIPECSRVFAPALDVDDMFDDIFGPIARDGAEIIEVGVRLQKALCLLGRGSDLAFTAAVVKHSELAVKRAELALKLEEDKQALRELASETQQCALRQPGRS